jgi:hypothetical protein
MRDVGPPQETDNTSVGTRTHGHTRKRASRRGSKGSAGRRLTTEKYPPKDLENWLKVETTTNRKELWRNGSNNMKGGNTEDKYDGDTRGMTRKEQVIISRLSTGYTRDIHGPRMNGITSPQCSFCDTRLTADYVLSPMELQRNGKNQKRDEDDTRCMEKRRRRNEKDHGIYEKNWIL